MTLHHAQRADQTLIASFLPSLYVNLGYANEATGDAAQSAHYYHLAADMGWIHQPPGDSQ